jgi:Zn-dependent protease with chaperone function
MIIRVCRAAAISAALLGFPAVLQADPQSAAQVEAEIGRKAVAEIEKSYEVADMPGEAARLTRLANELAVLTTRPDVSYTCKILETEELNALSLPGGVIYLTKGLFKALESDDEVAAVLAHEIAHNVNHDSLELIRRDKRLNKQMILAVLATVMLGEGTPGSSPRGEGYSTGVGAAEALVLGQAIKLGLLNGYTLEAERRADQQGLQTLRKSRYSPVAMLTVMEGIYRIAAGRPRTELGIFQTHPYPEERVGVIEETLQEWGIPINRRLVTQSLVATAGRACDEGCEAAQITMAGIAVFQPAVEIDGMSPMDRAQASAGIINQLLLDNLQSYQVTLREEAERVLILGRGKPMIAIYPGDADHQETTLQTLGRKVLENLRAAFWRETVERRV